MWRGVVVKREAAKMTERASRVAEQAAYQKFQDAIDAFDNDITWRAENGFMGYDHELLDEVCWAARQIEAARWQAREERLRAALDWASQLNTYADHDHNCTPELRKTSGCCCGLDLTRQKLREASPSFDALVAGAAPEASDGD